MKIKLSDIDAFLAQTKVKTFENWLGSKLVAHSLLKCSNFTKQITATVSPAVELLGSVSILQIGERLEVLL